MLSAGLSGCLPTPLQKLLNRTFTSHFDSHIKFICYSSLQNIMTIMPLHLSLATPEDAPRIAEIHMAAFATNGMLLAQFPTPEIRAGLQISIEEKALADIKDDKISVLVVREMNEQMNRTGNKNGKTSYSADDQFAKYKRRTGRSHQLCEVAPSLSLRFRLRRDCLGLA